MRLSVLLKTTGVVASFGSIALLAGLYSFNHFATVENQIDKSCIPVTGIAGPEDLQIDQRQNRIFISSFDRRAKTKDKDGIRGAIHVADLEDPLASSAWRDRTAGIPERFEPLGLSIFDDGEVKRLFVVNAATNSVELFDIAENGDLTHLESLTEHRLTSINDVAAVGPRAFYVSNDLAPGRSTLYGQLQYFSRAATGAVFYFDGQVWRHAAHGLRFANGVVVNKSGTRFYVSESSAMSLRVYDREPETGILNLQKTVSLPGAADNLNIADDGSILVGANPKPLTLGFHLRSSKARSPSLIVRYRDEVELKRDDVLTGAPTNVGGLEKTRGSRGEPELTILYQSDGDHLSAATVADAFDGKFVIGALVDDRYLICQLK
ncbi:MAG: SMP-30/gluconolactonase/LRE family protein [Pseudomonadota bacterium]